MLLILVQKSAPPAIRRLLGWVCRQGLSASQRAPLTPALASVLCVRCPSVGLPGTLLSGAVLGRKEGPSPEAVALGLLCLFWAQGLAGPSPAEERERGGGREQERQSQNASRLGPHRSSGGLGDRALQCSSASLGLRTPGAWGLCSFPARESDSRTPNQNSAPNDCLTSPEVWGPAEPGSGHTTWC